MQIAKLVTFEIYNGASWTLQQVEATQIDYDRTDAHMLTVRDTRHLGRRVRYYNPVRLVSIQPLPDSCRVRR